MKKAMSLLLTLALCLSLVISASAEEALFEGGVTEIQKYGNIVLDIDPAQLLESGFAYGDVLAVKVNGQDFQIPLCTNYSDVDTGELVARDSEGVLIIAINMGDFATTYGLAVKETAEDGTYNWVFPEGTSLEDITVSITMGEKEGYRDQYLIHQLERTNERSDYASDQVFANFRNIASGNLGENALFRSSSPVNNEIGRAAYADDFTETNRIQAVMNLANSNEDIEGYIAAGDFNSPYYASLYQSGKVKALNLGVDFTAFDFQSGLAEGLRFFAANEGPYLVHCTEGKDRAGFVSALLACLMGASFDEVVEDYMITYENYYHLTKGSEQYEAVKSSNIVSILETITATAKGGDLSNVDLTASAESYVKGIGLSDADLASLEANLSKDYTASPTEQEDSLPADSSKTEPAPAPEPEPAPEPIPEPEPEPTPEPEPEPVIEPAPVPNVVLSDEKTTYTVVSGDCLWSIASKLYGEGNRWTEIYALNKAVIKNPEMIYIGQVLTVPAA